MLHQDPVDESVIRIEELDYRTILMNEIDEEADRLLKHRLAQFVIEGFESLTIEAVMFLKAPEIEPIAPELDS